MEAQVEFPRVFVLVLVVVLETPKNETTRTRTKTRTRELNLSVHGQRSAGFTEFRKFEIPWTECSLITNSSWMFIESVCNSCDGLAPCPVPKNCVIP